LTVANIAIVVVTETGPHLSGASIVPIGYPSDDLGHGFSLVEEVGRLEMEDDQLTFNNVI
jgi:hypothetical protein